MSFFKKVSDWFSGNTQTAVQPLNTVAPDIATDSGATKMLGTEKEPAGYTMAGGRRVKTRRHRKSKKTHKRRRHH